MARDLQSSIVTKCAQVLDRLVESPDPMTFTEIVAATGFTKSSAHRIVTVLLGEGLVAFDPAGKTYSLGARPMRWARTAWQQIDLQQISDAELAQLRDRTGLNVALAIRTDDAILFIRTADLRPVRYAAKVGEQAPLHATAAGKVFLAFGEAGARCGLPEGYDLEKLTEHTITDLPALEADLTRTRARGFALSAGEEFLQISGIAAPILDYQSRVVASLGLWAPSRLASVDDLLERSAELIEAAAAMSLKFGAPLS